MMPTKGRKPEARRESGATGQREQKKYLQSGELEGSSCWCEKAPKGTRATQKEEAENACLKPSATGKKCSGRVHLHTIRSAMCRKIN